MITKDLFSLKGRVALITGGSRGIGKMIAEGFIAQGAKVYISARKAEACNQTALELSKDGGTCISIPGNVASVEGAKALAAAVMAREPKVDILVNNAGTAWGGTFDDFPEEGWDKVMDLNAKAPFFLTQAMAPALRKAASAERPAKVINIASIDGIYLTHRETYSYVTSKAGLIQLTRLMAARLVKDNIYVTAIAPGAFKSQMNREARDQTEEVAKFIPARRVGMDEDMAGAAIFLASRAGDYVIGSTLTVDGGVAFATQAMRGIDSDE
jgi:NAD(P)-dependent dehydrogenase (short-subunit alcohol dehydrogenase family)